MRKSIWNDFNQILFEILFFLDTVFELLFLLEFKKKNTLNIFQLHKLILCYNIILFPNYLRSWIDYIFSSKFEGLTQQWFNPLH